MLKNSGNSSELNGKFKKYFKSYIQPIRRMGLCKHFIDNFPQYNTKSGLLHWLIKLDIYSRNNSTLNKLLSKESANSF